jgi:hypothetical protein
MMQVEVRRRNERHNIKFLYSQRAVKNRRLKYGEIVSPLECIKVLWFSCLIYAESLLCVVGFPVALS